MRITFTSDGWDDYVSCADDRKALERIDALIEESARDPGVATGKPECLSGALSGFWSRRIDQEDRFMYGVQGDRLVISSARYHY